MSLYLDTSALVKLLVDEEGSDVARSARTGVGGNARTVSVAYVEAVSALTRMRKGGRLTNAQADRKLAELGVLWERLSVHEVTAGLIEQAASNAAAFGLRAYDALHLAGGQAFAAGEDVHFACWDGELREAAAESGFTLVPPS